MSILVNAPSQRGPRVSDARMPVYIPSSGRYDNSTGTLSRFPIHERVYLVVQHHQAYWYEPLSEATGVKMLVLPKGIERIAPTRKWIAEHAAAGGHAKHCQLDDDLYFYQREPGTQRLRTATKDEVFDMLMAIAFDLEIYAHVSVSDRNCNNWEPNPWQLNARCMRVLGYQTEEYLRSKLGRVEVMQDFDVSLQMLKRGLPSKVHFHWATAQGKTNAPGGCSKWRTLQLHNNAARRLARLHPNVVRLRQKNDRGRFGKRTEVTVQWKRAYRDPLQTAA